MSDEAVDDPAVAFAALSDPKRVAILRALWEAEKPLSFSALREAVGMRDSGQFNYHLGKLRGRFVTNDEDGYRLRVAGRRVVGALLSGAYTSDETTVSLPFEGSCPNCTGEMTFRYEGDRVWFDCAECDLAATNDVPPGVFEGYDTEAYPAVAQRYIRTRIDRLTAGFCTNCEGRLRTRVRPVADIWPEDLDDLAAIGPVPFAVYDCDRCGDRATTDLGLALLGRSAVVAFFHDHDVDTRDRPLWSFMRLQDSAVVSSDPFRATVTFHEDGETLTLTVDECLTVLDTERH